MTRSAQGPSTGELAVVPNSLKHRLQRFLGRRSVQIALVVVMGAITLAIALFGRYIEPYYLLDDTDASRHADAADDPTASVIFADDARPQDTVGGKASRDVYVTHTFKYLSLEDADIRKQQEDAWRAVAPIWRYDQSLNFELYNNLYYAFQRAREHLCPKVLLASEDIDALDLNADGSSAKARAIIKDFQGNKAYRDCVKLGLRHDKLTEAQHAELVCDDRLRKNFRKNLGIATFEEEDCNAFVQTGLSNELRNTLQGHIDDMMSQYIVADDDAMQRLQAAVAPNAQNRGFVLVRSIDDNEGENDDEQVQDPRARQREPITSLDGFYTLEEAQEFALESEEPTNEDNSNKAEIQALQSVAAQLLRPNTFYDKDATENARKAAAGRKYNRHEITTYHRGELLLARGERIGLEHAQIINQMNVTAPRIVNRYWEAFGLAVLLFLTALGVWTASSEERHTWATRDLTMMGLVLMLQIALVRIGFELSNQSLADGKSSLQAIAILAALPYSAGALVVKSLTSSRNAFAFTAISGVLVAAISGYDLTWISVALLSSIIAASTLRAVEKRSSIVRAAGLGALTTAAVILALIAVGHLGEGGVKSILLISAAGAGFLLTSVIGLGLPTLLEFTFRYTTRSTLLELLNDEHPLRAKFHKAPGTLAHSLAVADLTSTACREIGANALLARVGATFHDVGKLRAPGYFGENNPTHNPHDECDARESARRIIDHVIHGVEDAKKYGLPKEVIEFIQTHHGTMLVQHFYNVTCEAEGTENVDVQDFRYPGPLPQTKETGICLMADGVEAMVRAMPDKSPENIERVVRKKIAAVRVEGQLTESGLTLQEVQIVEDSLIEQLCNMHHKRPTYAKAPKDADTKDAPTP